MTFKAIIHASEILTGVGVRKKDGRKVVESDLGRIIDGAIVYSCRKEGNLEVPQKIEWVGQTSEIPKKWSRISKKNLKLKQAIIPGMIDCHTHLIFAGDRSEEFAARCAGASYQEIAASGGGIHSTVRATRCAPILELETLAVKRIKEMFSFGVKTVEIKSGYGLSISAELKILGIIQELKKRFPLMTFSSTFLGAHAFPPDRSRENYMRDILSGMLPEIVSQKLADFCDVFIDEGYFSREEGKKILNRAQELGLKVKIHADELTHTNATSLAVELNATSADHLLKISDENLVKLAQSNTVAVLLPGTSFYLKANFAPARKLIDAGASVALATDFNPGTCMCLSLPIIMSIAALYLNMSRSEIFASVTFNPAKALGLESQKGSLEVGKDADFSILQFPKFEEMYYRLGWIPH